MDWCECGRGPRVLTRGPVDPELCGCEACNAVDGVGPRQRDVVNLIRRRGGFVTIADVAGDLGLSREAAARLLYRMRKGGLVTSRLRDDAANSYEQCGWGGKKFTRAQRSTAVFSLARRTV